MKENVRSPVISFEDITKLLKRQQNILTNHLKQTTNVVDKVDILEGIFTKHDITPTDYKTIIQLFEDNIILDLSEINENETKLTLLKEHKDRIEYYIKNGILLTDEKNNLLFMSPVLISLIEFLNDKSVKEKSSIQEGIHNVLKSLQEDVYNVYTRLISLYDDLEIETDLDNSFIDTSIRDLDSLITNSINEQVTNETIYKQDLIEPSDEPQLQKQGLSEDNIPYEDLRTDKLSTNEQQNLLKNLFKH